MVEQENNISINKYLDMLFRHRILFLISFFLVTATGAVITFLLPDIYRSTTLILVEPQKIPENYVHATVSASVEDRLNTLTKQVMSRTRLQRIIDEFGLYKKDENKKSLLEILSEKYSAVIDRLGLSGYVKKSGSREEIIDLMRKNIDIDVRNYGRGKTNYFSINYTGKDPEVVMNVTNKLASLFIEENLKVRELQVRGTTDFLEKELDSIKAKLEEQEEAMKKFKQQYMGELPEQQQANLRIMDQLQLRLQTIDESLRGMGDRKELIQNRLNDIVLSVPAYRGNEGGSGSPVIQLPVEAELKQLKAQLADLKTKYTDQYPDIKRLKKNIETLKKRLETDNKDKEQNTNIREEFPMEALNSLAMNDPLYMSTKTDLESIKLEIKALKREKRKVKRQLKEFQSRIEKTPHREQQLITLTRDYEIMKANYSSLLEKKLQARLSENLERKQQGEQFRMLDPANFPEIPYKPNRLKLMLLSVMAGLGAGIGLVFLVEYLDTSFHDVEDMENFTKLPVLAAIPRIEAKKIYM